MAAHDLPIRQKLMRMMLATSAVVLLVTCASFLGYEALTFRQALARRLTTLGEIIAAHSTGAVAFDNQSDATEILSALKVEHHIVAAALYDREGKLFSRYPVDARDSAFPAAPGTDGYRFSSGRLSGFSTVVQVAGSQRLGTLYLSSDLEEMYARLRLYSAIALLAIGVSAAIAYSLSRKLQHQISGPILSLAETAKAVSDRRDYSARATQTGGDEIGLLTDAFNHMLEQIEQQNLALHLAYDNLRQHQQAITQQERLRAVGQMASGIAHDINNAISPASLYVGSLLAREPNLSERSREYLTMTQRAIDDVAQTVGRLREFYRQREPQLVLLPIDLNLVAKGAAELTRARWGDISQHRGIPIHLVQALSPGPAMVLGVESEIREALINLIFNAVDALAETGTITVSTRTIDPHPWEGDRVAGPAVCVEVTDTGTGMDEETHRRCLEPFFTTKGERGTGLGLAMVYGTVQRHNGAIQIESAVGRGTTIRLLFQPAVQAVAQPPPPGPAAAPAAQAEVPLRLLIVDDDAALLRSLGQTLSAEGHRITLAEGGQAGLDILAAASAAGGRFDAVLTDMGMPGIDGRRMAEAVKAASPETTVCLLSGWGQFFESPPDIPPHVDRVLNKPPRLADLRNFLATVKPLPPL